jgi:hypothetical protein
MDRIHYSGDSILTGSKIAHALLDYAQALAQVGTSDTVEVPTVHEDGTPGQSNILIGPSSQLISDVETSGFDDVVDDALVADLEGKADRLRRFGTSSPASEAHPIEPAVGWSEFDEL